MWVENFLKIGAKLVIAEIGALAVWAFVVNRVVIQWIDGPFKTATILLLGLGLATLGVLSALSTRVGRRRIVFWVWPALLASFGAGEIHRAWLRSTYGARSTNASPWSPVTTNELELRHFRLELATFGTTRLRVVALSDLHVTDETDPAYVERVRTAIRGLAPDALFMTGDYISKPERLPALERWLQGLPRATYGTYAVLGNHDHWTERADSIAQTLEHAGVNVLRGTCASIAVSGALPLRVCGTEEPWGPALSPALTDGSVSATLVLSHTPDNVYALAEQGATAVFAGHTHGGQVRLPWLGPLIVPSRYGRRFDQGQFVVDKTHLFVSAGVGADAPPVRLWCPPDLVAVDLVGARPDAPHSKRRMRSAVGG